MHRPDSNERWLAAATHIGSLFVPALLPAGMWIWQRRKSEFVAAHAQKALVEFLVWKSVFLIAGVSSLAWTISRIYGFYQADWQGFSVWDFFVRAAIGWSVITFVGLVSTIGTCRQAAAAFAGEPAGRSRGDLHEIQ